MKSQYFHGHILILSSGNMITENAVYVVAPTAVQEKASGLQKQN